MSYAEDRNLDVTNPAPRCPVVLLLDVSGSMEGEPLKELNAGVQQFFRETSDDETASMSVEAEVITYGGEVKIYSGTKNGQPVGYAIESFSNNGFSGEVRLIVGFNPDGTIYRTEVLSQHETPGLGDKMERSKSDFAQQFDGKNPADFHLAVSKDGGDVDAITAATISSRAYTEAIARAYNVFCQITNHNTMEEGKYE